jgi:hypothetical protein
VVQLIWEILLTCTSSRIARCMFSRHIWVEYKTTWTTSRQSLCKHALLFFRTLICYVGWFQRALAWHNAPWITYPTTQRALCDLRRLNLDRSTKNWKWYAFTKQPAATDWHGGGGRF